jgi:hypothetical protein
MILSRTYLQKSMPARAEHASLLVLSISDEQRHLSIVVAGADAVVAARVVVGAVAAAAVGAAAPVEVGEVDHLNIGAL